MPRARSSTSLATAGGGTRVFLDPCCHSTQTLRARVLVPCRSGCRTALTPAALPSKPGRQVVQQVDEVVGVLFLGG